MTVEMVVAIVAFRLLHHRVVRSIPELTTHVGKESIRLEEVDVKLEHDSEGISPEYIRLGQCPWRSTVLPDNMLFFLYLYPRIDEPERPYAELPGPGGSQ